MFFCVFLRLSPLVLWYCWFGLSTCKNCLPYNLYCVGGDVKHCLINQSINQSISQSLYGSKLEPSCWLFVLLCYIPFVILCDCVLYLCVRFMTSSTSEFGAFLLLLLSLFSADFLSTSFYYWRGNYVTRGSSAKPHWHFIAWKLLCINSEKLNRWWQSVDCCETLGLASSLWPWYLH